MRKEFVACVVGCKQGNLQLCRILPPIWMARDYLIKPRDDCETCFVNVRIAFLPLLRRLLGRIDSITQFAVNVRRRARIATLLGKRIV